MMEDKKDKLLELYRNLVKELVQSYQLHKYFIGKIKEIEELENE